jgi:thiopurine S-methyltransferase
MHPDFWLDRWRHREIGFHQLVAHRALDSHWHSLAIPAGARVFVPLAGKSLDMRWLADRGHHVIGVELAETAIREFFAEATLTPTETLAGALRRFAAGPFELYCGDFFALDSKLLGVVRGVFDRAALVALPPAMRADYARHMSALLPSGCHMLLVTMEYEQSRMAGPPHSVAQAEVQQLYGHWQTLSRVRADEQIDDFAKFRERGLASLVEAVYTAVR